MGKTERLYRIKQLLQQSRIVSKEQFLSELEISPATFKRDLAYLRDRMNAPVEFDKDAGGYRFAHNPHHTQQELPGIWFSAEEIYALLTMQKLLSELQPGLLSPHIKPLVSRLHKALAAPQLPHDEIQKRIRLLSVNARGIQLKSFDAVSSALLCRRQLAIDYFHRIRNLKERRILSPQRLIYYRDNWYLEAWCHLRLSMRSFSLDAIVHVELLDHDAIEVPEAELDALSNAGYGIFNGINLQWATLRFAPEKARWISKECWHPQQKSSFDADGYYILQIPYSDDRELVTDILRHVPEVMVLEPPALRQRVLEQLEKSVAMMKMQSME